MAAEPRTAAGRALLDWAYDVILGKATAISFNDAMRAAALIHDDAQWNERPIHDVIREAASRQSVVINPGQDETPRTGEHSS